MRIGWRILECQTRHGVIVDIEISPAQWTSCHRSRDNHIFDFPPSFSSTTTGGVSFALEEVCVSACLVKLFIKVHALDSGVFNICNTSVWCQVLAVGIVAYLKAHRTACSRLHKNIAQSVSLLKCSTSVNTTNSTLPRCRFRPLRTSNPVVIVNDVDRIDDSSFIGLVPVPPPEIDWPPKGKLPDGDVLVDTVRVPRLDGVVNSSHKGLFDRSPLSGIQTVMAKLPGHALNIRNVLSIRMTCWTIGKVGVGSIIHVVLLAMSRLKTVGWISSLELVYVKGFIAIRQWRPICVDVQTISKEPTSGVCVQEGQPHHLDVLSVNSNVLSCCIVRNTNFIVF